MAIRRGVTSVFSHFFVFFFAPVLCAHIFTSLQCSNIHVHHTRLLYRSLELRHVCLTYQYHLTYRSSFAFHITDQWPLIFAVHIQQQCIHEWSACEEHKTHKHGATYFQFNSVRASDQAVWMQTKMIGSTWFKRNANKDRKPSNDSCWKCQSSKMCSESHRHNIGPPTDVTVHYHVTKNARGELEGKFSTNLNFYYGKDFINFYCGKAIYHTISTVYFL